MYDDSEPDNISFIWGNARYSSQRLYRLAHFSLQVPRNFLWNWKSNFTPRLKFFYLVDGDWST
jgi:hypothetical protein